MADRRIAENSDFESDIDLEQDEASSSSPVKRGRGKGRGKRTRRSSGPASSRRGRSRHRSGTTAEQAIRNIERRQSSMKDEINQMDLDECRTLLLSVLEKNPTVMVDIMRPSVRPGGGYHPGPDSVAPDWCVCTRCRQMNTAREEVCCGKQNCISLVPDFQVVILDEAVLSLARLMRRDILVYDDEPDQMAAFRHTAYRQYILWTFGRLTSGDRRVIPSCCVWKIRDKFPDPLGRYTGFTPARLG